MTPRDELAVIAEQPLTVRAALAVADPAALPCGHPFSSVVSADEGTSYCGECAVPDPEAPRDA